MRIDPLAMTRLTVKPSRRGVLRAAGAGALAAVLSGRLGLPAGAQASFPTRIRVLHAAPGWERLRFFSMVKRSSTSSITARPVIGSKWIQEWCGPRFAATGLGSTISSSIPSPRWSRMKTYLILSDPLVIPVAVDRSPVAADSARVRVIHATADIPAVDIAVKGGDVIVDDLQYGELSDAVEVPAGTYDLEVRLHGTAEVVLDLPVVVEPGIVYDVVAHGKPGSEPAPLTAAVLTDEARAGTPASAATPSA